MSCSCRMPWRVFPRVQPSPLSRVSWIGLGPRVPPHPRSQTLPGFGGVLVLHALTQPETEPKTYLSVILADREARRTCQEPFAIVKERFGTTGLTGHCTIGADAK